MTDIQFLFAILGGLYLWECTCWLRRGGVAFSSWRGRRWAMQHPATMFGNQTGGFIFAPPLPPLGTMFIAYQPPFSLGPAGVLWFIANNVNPGWRPFQSGHFVPWHELKNLKRHGKKLRLDNNTLFTAPTATRAALVHQQLVDIANGHVDHRTPAIEKFLRAAFDEKSIMARQSEFATQTKTLRMMTNTLFLLLFVAAPLLIGLIGLKLVWLWLMLALAALTITSSVLFARVHRRYWPNAEDERFTHSLIIALAPATTIRAVDFVSRPLLENFHPLVAAKFFLPAATFQPYARRLLLDLRHPIQPTCPNPQPEAIATEQFFRQMLLATVEAWLTGHQIDPSKLCQPPLPADESCRAYCPRCEAQFTTAAGACADCGGVNLVAFPKAS